MEITDSILSLRELLTDGAAVHVHLQRMQGAALGCALYLVMGGHTHASAAGVTLSVMKSKPSPCSQVGRVHRQDVPGGR